MVNQNMFEKVNLALVFATKPSGIKMYTKLPLRNQDISTKVLSTPSDMQESCLKGPGFARTYKVYKFSR